MGGTRKNGRHALRRFAQSLYYLFHRRRHSLPLLALRLRHHVRRSEGWPLSASPCTLPAATASGSPAVAKGNPSCHACPLAGIHFPPPGGSAPWVEADFRRPCGTVRSSDFFWVIGFRPLVLRPTACAEPRRYRWVRPTDFMTILSPARANHLPQLESPASEPPHRPTLTSVITTRRIREGWFVLARRPRRRHRRNARQHPRPSGAADPGGEGVEGVWERLGRGLPPRIRCSSPRWWCAPIREIAPSWRAGLPPLPRPLGPARMTTVIPAWGTLVV